MAPPQATSQHGQGRRPGRPPHRGADEAEEPKPRGSEGGGSGQDIGERVKTFLGEYRIIVPALAALFGFQLTVAFQESYMRMAAVDRAVNFAGVACTAAAILCLLVPASYHRFTSKLEETEEFLAFARRSISLAFVFIPLGIGLALYLQAVRTFQSHAAAAAVAAVALGVFAAAWWVMPHQRAAQQGLLHHRDSGGDARDAGSRER